MLSAYEASKKAFTCEEYDEYKAQLAARHKMFNDKKLFKRLREQTGHCECCGVPANETYRLEVHHVIPRRFDECTNNEDNLLVLCTKCHRKLEYAIGFNNDVETIKKKTDNFLTRHKYDWINAV